MTWNTQVSNIFSVGRGLQIYRNWTSNGGDTLGLCCKSGKNTHLLVIMRVRLLQKICFPQLDKPDLIQKRKRLENPYKKCAQLLGNAFNVIYAVYLLRTHK